MAPGLDPPFVEPLWYRYRHRHRHPLGLEQMRLLWYRHRLGLEQMRLPRKRCSVHDICERIEHDLLLLTHPEGLPPELEDNFQTRKIKRLIKIDEKSEGWGEYRRTRKSEKRQAEAAAAADAAAADAAAADAAAAAAAELEQMTHNVQDLDLWAEHWNPKPKPVWNIEVGKKINVLSLLSRRGKRNYLIKGKEKETEEVTIDELKTKYVLLLFWFLPLPLSDDDDGDGPHEIYPNFMADLEDMYSAYNPTGEFEVVFVAFGTNEDAFHAIFSRMPWLAIPHQDQQGRDLFRTKFAIPYCPRMAKSVLFDPNGRVLLDQPKTVISSRGVHCFPFTKDRMEEVTSTEIREADALLDKIVLKKEEPPLTALLGYNIITSEGNEVSTSVLEGKTVGLYYLDNSTKGCQRTRKVLKIWKSLKDMPDKDLEIVFVNEDCTNLSYAKAIYKDEFGSPMPWYSLLPSNRSKLSKVFRYNWRRGPQQDYLSNAAYLIILKPDKYQSLSLFGFEILEKFGIKAYPFTLETVVNIVTSKQKKRLVLSELLSPTAPLLGGNSKGDKEYTFVYELSGKNVILLFATHSCYGAGSFLPALKNMYHEKKGTKDDFEIIYISFDCNESPSSFPKCIQEMPWLVHAHVPEFAVSLFVEVFKIYPFLPAIAAFGRDGHLEAKESNLSFKKDWNSKYPFIDLLEEEVCRELIRKHKWDLKSIYFPEPRS